MENEIDECNQNCIEINREQIFFTLRKAASAQLELILETREDQQSMDSFIPVPKNISDHIFKIIDGSNQGVINYGIVLEAQMVEVCLDCDQTLFDLLLELPQTLQFQHPLYIDCDEFSVVLQYFCLLQSVVRTFRDQEYNFDNNTQVEARQVNGKGLGFISTDLLEERVKQVNYIEMYKQSLNQLNAWVITNKVKIKLMLQHKLFTWVKYILRDSENQDNDTSYLNIDRQTQMSKQDYNSDCDSRNTDMKLMDNESNNEFIKSLDIEIERLKKTWQEGTIMVQQFGIDNISKSGRSNKSSENLNNSLNNSKHLNNNLYAGITLPSVNSSKGYDSNNLRLTSNNSNNFEDNNQKEESESSKYSPYNSKNNNDTRIRQCALRSNISNVKSATYRSNPSNSSNTVTNPIKSDRSGNNLNDSNQKDLSSLCIEKREGVFHQLQEGIEYFNKSVIGDDRRDKINSNQQSIIEKTTQANSTDANNAEDLYQMIQDNMKEMDEIKNMLTTI